MHRWCLDIGERPQQPQDQNVPLATDPVDALNLDRLFAPEISPLKVLVANLDNHRPAIAVCEMHRR